MLFLLEIKKYLLSCKSFVIWLFAAAAACFLLYAGVKTILAGDGFIEPFSIGVVDSGSSPEIRYVFDFFGEIISLEYLTETEANNRINECSIPAYVVLPEYFAEDIMTGVNTPFTLRVNRGYPLRAMLTKLLASGGVAFLSSSQAGIYATLDYAAVHGLDRAFTDAYVLVPINVAFVKKLLEYDVFFESRVLPLADGDPLLYFCGAFTAFLLMLSLLSFAENLRGYNAGIYGRYHMAGVSRITLNFIRLTGVVIVYIPVTALLYGLFFARAGGINPFEAVIHGVSLACCIGSFGMAAAALIKNKAGFGLLVFVSGLCMFMFSGALVPFAFIPQKLHALRFASIPYLAVEGSYTSVFALLGFSVIFFGVACFADVFNKGVSGAA